MNKFEDRLLTQLREVVAERESGTAQAARRTVSKRRVAFTGLAASGLAASAAVVVPMLGGDRAASPAFAIEASDDTITVDLFEPRDAEGLERALEAAGVAAEVDYPPLDKKCRQPRYAADPNPPRVEYANPTGSRFIVRRADTEGRTLVIELSADAKGPGIEAFTFAHRVDWATGPVAPCELIDVPTLPPLPSPPTR